MPINPFEGEDVRLQLTDWTSGEDLPRGFVRDVRNPFASEREPDVEIKYFPPLYEGLASDYPHLTIGLKKRGRRDDRFYGISPYYYELISEHAPSEPISARRYSRPFEKLILHVDRDIEIIFSQPFRGVPSSRELVYVLEFNASLSRFFYLPPNSLSVEVKRYQLQSQVPQSSQDTFNISARPRIWRTFVGQPIDDPAIVGRCQSEAIVLKSETATGITLSFFAIIAVSRGHETGSEGRMTLLAELSLGHWHMQYPGAYFYKVSDQSGQQRMRVDILTSPRNVYAALRVNTIGLDVSALLGSDALFGALSLSTFWNLFDLRFNREVSRLQVPRQGQSLPTSIETYSLDHEQGQRTLTIESLSDPDREELIDWLTFAVGFVPVVGDLLDIGEFIKALVAGQDLQGRAVEDWELTVMALALLPGLPGSLRRFSDRIDAASETLRARGITRDNVVEALDQYSPRLASALRAGSFGEALRRLASTASANHAISFGQIRDEEVLETVLETLSR